VLGLKHPDTLISVYCLTYLLVKQYHVNAEAAYVDETLCES
jgi:hypothetical protein